MTRTVSLTELRKMTGKRFFLYAVSDKFNIPVQVQKAKLISSIKSWAEGNAEIKVIETPAGFFVNSIG